MPTGSPGFSPSLSAFRLSPSVSAFRLSPSVSAFRLPSSPFAFRFRFSPSVSAFRLSFPPSAFRFRLLPDVFRFRFPGLKSRALPGLSWLPRPSFTGSMPCHANPKRAFQALIKGADNG
jgi:hypothetical protein